MCGSSHAHGIMKLKLYPDSIYMVTKVYAGNKATEILECLIKFGQISNEVKLEFAAAES